MEEGIIRGEREREITRKRKKENLKKEKASRELETEEFICY